ncbi:MAG: hypothetical protein PVG82_03470 [Chromatiales bacterium]|jgi:hypothetical protein
MLRLLGFIVGALLTAIVLFDLDPHELLHRGEALVDDSREWLQAAAQTPVPEAPTPEPIRKPAPVEVPVDRAPKEEPVPIEAVEQGAAISDDTAPDRTIHDHEELPLTEPVPVATPIPIGGWQPLWRPFNSEVSARGFAGQISDITGRETRVRRLGPRSHQVDVAYATEAERRDILQRLELLTGIRLREEGS